MSKIRFHILILSCFSILPAQSESNLKIRNIDFIGVHELKIDLLEKKVRTKEYNIFNRSVFDRRLVRLDAISLKSFYRSNGFLNVVVKDSIIVDDEDVSVFFVIKEGKQFILSQISIEGNSLIDDEKIAQMLYYRLNEYYDPVSATENIMLLEQEYDRLGKLFKSISVTPTIFDSVSVVMNIDEGPDVYIQRYFIEGLNDYDEKIITREIAFSVGQKYNKDHIDLTRQYLLETGIFSYVGITPVLVANSDTLVNLVIEVRHHKQREWISEGGYYPVPFYQGAEPIPGAGINLEWRNRSLNKSTVNFSTKMVGYALLSENNLRPKIRYDMGFSNQWFLGKRIPTSIRLYYESYKKYELAGDPLISRYGIRFASKKRFSLKSYIEAGMQWEKFIEPDNLKKDIEQRSIHVTSQFDRSDNPIFPTTGYQITSTAVWTGGILGGNREFFKLDFGYSFYRPLLKNIVFAARIKSGQLFRWQVNNDQNFDKFYLGGSTSLRGWDELKFKVDENNRPAGDLARLLINGEIRFPVYWIFGGEIFYDGGLLTDTVNNFAIKKLIWNKGIGLTITSPLGPIRLDFAVPINSPDKWNIQLGVQYMY